MKTNIRSILRLIGLLLTVIAASPPNACAQGGVPLWTNFYHGPSNGDDSAQSIAVDNSGNVIVAGSSYNGSNPDYATIEYSAAGVPLWTNRWNAYDDTFDSARAIAVDGIGSVYVTGTASGDSYVTLAYSSSGTPLWTNRFGATLGNPSLFASNNGNVYVAGSRLGAGNSEVYVTLAYSSSGVPLWTNSYSEVTNASDFAWAIAGDNSGNAYVTGRSLGSKNYGFATVAYSSAGLSLWTNRYDGPADARNEARAIAVGDGKVFVTGDADGGAYLTLAYSSAGNPLWTNKYSGGFDSDYGRSIAADGAGNAYVTGVSETMGGELDCVTIAYSKTGVSLWTNRYANAQASAIVTDISGNVYVTGYTYGDSSFDFVTLAYSSAGVPLWTNRFNGPGNGDDYPMAIAVDTSGNVSVTGWSSNGSNDDYLTIKYSSSLPAPPRLHFQRLNNQLLLSWTNVDLTALQSAPDLTATFTNIPNATSPYTNPITAPQQFFRLAQ